MATRPPLPPMTMRATSDLSMPARESAGGRPEVGIGELRAGEHGERILHEMDARRANAIADGLTEDVGFHLGAFVAKLDAQHARVGAARLAEAYDLRLALQRVAPESLEIRIVAIEDGRAAGNQPLQNLGLG